MIPRVRAVIIRDRRDGTREAHNKIPVASSPGLCDQTNNRPSRLLA